MRPTTTRAFPLVCAALVAMGCGSSKDDEVQAPADLGVDAGREASTSAQGEPQAEASAPINEVSAGDSGVSDACALDGGADDVPDDDGLDTNCDGADGVVGRDVYLDPVKGQDSNAGTPIAPLKSLDKALDVAMARSGSVLVADGTLAVDKIDREGKVAIYGGYGPSFNTVPRREHTIIRAAAESGVYFDKATTVTLAHLTILGVDAAGDTGAYAVRSNVASLTLHDVLVQAGSAPDGAPGSAGPTGVGKVDGGVGSSLWYVKSNGAKGLTCSGVAQPAYTNGADVGKANAEGNAAGSRAAGQGTDGTPGAGASSDPGYLGGFVVWGVGSNGGDDGTAGYGGPGGVDFAAIPYGGGTYWVYGGGGGSGGCAGKGGSGGKSGGGSVAVLVLQGKLTMDHSLVKTGSAGNGGDGGAGGLGANGGAGGLPASENNASPPASPISFPSPCTTASDPLKQDCKAYGGDGGRGGYGGQGGAGSGGWTIGIAVAKDASADVDPSAQFQLGRPGLGGASGSSKGPDGQKRPTFQFR